MRGLTFLGIGMASFGAGSFKYGWDKGESGPKRLGCVLISLGIIGLLVDYLNSQKAIATPKLSVMQSSDNLVNKANEVADSHIGHAMPPTIDFSNTVATVSIESPASPEL